MGSVLKAVLAWLGQHRTIAAAISGAVWGISVSLAPLDFVFIPGLVVWLPSFIYMQRLDAKRHGLFPRVPVRIAVASIIVAVAIVAPVKWQDRYQLGPFDRRDITIGELDALLWRDYLPIRFPEGRMNDQIHLPAQRLSLRRLAADIERQTGLTFRFGGCDVGASILWGMFPMSMSFKDDGKAPS